MEMLKEMAAWHKKGITGNVRPVVERKTEVLHLLCDFLLNPKTALDFLHDKSGTLHNGATPVTEECNQLNVVHSQGEAATNHILSVRHMKNYKKDNGTHVLKKSMQYIWDENDEILKRKYQKVSFIWQEKYSDSFLFKYAMEEHATHIIQVIQQIIKQFELD